MASRDPVTFEEHLERSMPYVAAIHAAGDLAWFEAGHPRRAKVVERLGLADDIAELDLRRALWARRNGSAA